MGGAGRRAFDRTERRRAQGVGPAHRLWRDRGVCERTRRIAEDRRKRPQADGKLPAHRQGHRPRRRAAESQGRRHIRHGRAGAGHGLCRGAAIALCRRRAARRRRRPRAQSAGRHRRREAARRRRRHRHHGRRHAGGQEPAQGDLERRAGRASRQRARARGVCGDRPRQELATAWLTRTRATPRRRWRAPRRVPRRIPHALRLSRADGADERDRRGQPRRQIGRALGRHPGGDQPPQRRRPHPADRTLQDHAAPALPRRRFRPARQPRGRVRRGPPVEGGRQAGEADLDARRRHHLRQIPPDDGASHRGRLRRQRQARRLASPCRCRIRGGLRLRRSKTAAGPHRDEGLADPAISDRQQARRARHREPRRAAVAVARRRQRPQRLRHRELRRRDRQGSRQGSGGVPPRTLGRRAAHAASPAHRRRRCRTGRASATAPRSASAPW